MVNRIKNKLRKAFNHILKAVEDVAAFYEKNQIF